MRITNKLQVYICSRSIYYTKQHINLAFILFLICIPFVDIRAQFLTDSLSSRLQQKDLSPEDRITTMGLLARSKSITDKKNAIHIAEQALPLTGKLRDAKYKAFLYTTLVHLYFTNDDKPMAQQALDSALWYADKTSDKRIKVLRGLEKVGSRKFSGNLMKRKQSTCRH